MGVEIRDYNKHDRFALMSLSEDEWHPQILATVLSIKENNSIEKCLVAEADGDIVGFIYGFVLPNKTLIPEFMYVVPNARKNGVGAELIKQLELTSGCTASMIFYNKSLHCFYEHQGYLAGENLEVAVKEIGGTSE